MLLATDLRGEIRRHPFLAAGLGACLGFAGGPPVLRTTMRALKSRALSECAYFFRAYSNSRTLVFASPIIMSWISSVHLSCPKPR